MWNEIETFVVTGDKLPALNLVRVDIRLNPINGDIFIN